MRLSCGKYVGWQAWSPHTHTRHCPVEFPHAMRQPVIPECSFGHKLASALPATVSGRHLVTSVRRCCCCNANQLDLSYRAGEVIQYTHLSGRTELSEA